MGKELLEKVVNQGVDGNLNSFFCDVSNNYVGLGDSLPNYDDEQFTDFQAIGEIVFNPNEKLVVVTARVLGDLTERSGKKAQYEKAKKILKDFMKYDAGIFVFSDAAGSFRFSIVYGQAQGTKRVFSNFRRFTYFVSRDQTNKTFYDRIGRCDFSSLDIIKDAFSVEKVNKEFYQQIARYYYRLTGKNDCKKELVLPSVGEGDERKYEEFAVRLIGRIIFCWFLRHKKSRGGIPLIPREALSLGAAESHGNYYHSIMEPLFFEVMNRPVKERKTVTIPQSELIPFLNGGLFEPHCNDYYEKAPNYALKIPDSWFADFFGVLEQYNFTIDENSTVDADVSVDPEMLGRIFENLLAEVVPETDETARKATGSYYTPRAIVDYMVEQSLKQYLHTKTSLPEDKLDSLLSYEDSEIDLSDAERNAVVTALKEIKVIDPACGSGAFPMGILHRMLLVLEKVDPRLEIWKRLYLGSYHPVMRKIIEDKLKKGNERYIRKLTIIQDSIYGVDIQPLAVEITKLRCFLSLIVDEIVLDNEENRGIEPLPNLEFKFVAANTLIGLPTKEEAQGAFETSKTITKLKEIRERYLNSYGAEKAQIEKEFCSTKQELFEDSLKWGTNNCALAEAAKKLTEWDPFSYESCSWFDLEWMFGIEDGFDVVIANPPYGFRNVLTAEEKIYFRKVEKIAFSSGDSAELFSKKSFDKLVKKDGILTFIIPKKSLYGDAWDGFRRDYWGKYKLTFLLDVSKAFEEVLFEESAFGLVKTNQDIELKLCYLTKSDTIFEFARASKDTVFMLNNTVQIYKAFYPDSLFNKIQSRSVKGKLVEGHLGLAIGTNFFTEEHTDYKLLKGIDIERWVIKQHRYLKNKQQLNWEEARKFLKPKVLCQVIVAHIENPKPHIKITAALDGEGIIITNTLMSFKLSSKLSPKFWLGYLNSTFLSWYAYNFIYSRAIRTMHFYNAYIQQIPIPESATENQKLQKPIVQMVDQILAITSDSDYLSNPAKQGKVKELERQIDRMVYELYGLTEEEIGVVEGRK